MTEFLQGKVALITGGASGIGAAATRVFANAGAIVVFSDVTEGAGEKLARTLRELKHEALFIRADVSDRDDVARMIDEVVLRYGHLDCAFNNAGIEGESAETADCTEENWDRVMSVNVRGLWLCMKYELTAMLPRGRGVIVNNSSVAGIVGFTGIPAYVASKHAVLGLTKAAALEYAKKGIRVNAVCPGVIRTPMVERVTEGAAETEAQYVALEPVGRMGEPEEVADAVAWLCSDHATFVTGHPLVVDGGLVIQ